MEDLLLDGERFTVSAAALFNSCQLFQTKPSLLTGPYGVQSRVSAASFRVFVDAIGGSGVTVTKDTVGDLMLLSDEFKFAALSTAISNWRAGRLSLGRGQVILNDCLRSQERVVCQLDQEVGVLRLAQGSLQVAVRDLQSMAGQECNAITRLEAAVGTLQRDHKRMQETIARQESELVAARRRDEELGDQVQRLGEENRQLRELIEALQHQEESKKELNDIRLSVAAFIGARSRKEIPPSATEAGIFNYLIKAQKSPFDRSVIASQSSGDIVRVIDPNSTDNYSSGSQETEWIQFEFQRAITVNGFRIQSAHHDFLRTWSFMALDTKGHRTVLYSATDDARLKGNGNSVRADVPATSSTIFRIEKRGVNWQGTQFFRVKNVELFSEDFPDGVFKELVGRVSDPHRADVLVTGSNFDFQKYHRLGATGCMCTLSDQGYPWIQWELAKGMAAVQAYRVRQVEDNLLDLWSLQVSNNAVDWTVIDRREGPQGNDLVKLWRVQPTAAWRYFRLVYEGQTVRRGTTIKLKLRHFDIFGLYLDTESQ